MNTFKKIRWGIPFSVDDDYNYNYETNYYSKVIDRYSESVLLSQTWCNLYAAHLSRKYNVPEPTIICKCNSSTEMVTYAGLFDSVDNTITVVVGPMLNNTKHHFWGVILHEFRHYLQNLGKIPNINLDLSWMLSDTPRKRQYCEFSKRMQTLDLNVQLPIIRDYLKCFDFERDAYFYQFLNSNNFDITYCNFIHAIETDDTLLDMYNSFRNMENNRIDMPVIYTKQKSTNVINDDCYQPFVNYNKLWNDMKDEFKEYTW